MLTVIISKKKIQLTGADFTCKVNKVYVRFGERFKHFQSPTMKYENLDRVRFVLKTRFGYARFKKNKELSDAVISFLHNYYGKVDIGFDCYAFATTVKGIPVHTREYLLRFWKLSPLRKPTPGDVLFFVNGFTFSHAAIYLGKGLYISVYGAGGDLEVSSLRDMRKLYKAGDVMMATPIKRADNL